MPTEPNTVIQVLVVAQTHAAIGEIIDRLKSMDEDSYVHIESLGALMHEGSQPDSEVR